MNISLECIPCIINSYLRLLNSGVIPKDLQEIGLRRLLNYLSQVDFQQSPPVLGRELHRMIRRELNIPDPYKEIKEKYNNKMLDFYSDFENMINNADDPFDMAMRLAIAGNVIDFGSQHQLEIMETINTVVKAKIAINESEQLKNDLKSAKVLLYIGDNCGEIVLDKLFLEKINIPEKYFAVRNGPVINDVTIDDATKVAMNEIADVITTGDDAPGAVWESTSNEFKTIFERADVIISKGQGNLEGLIDINKNIYFLLVTKCDLIANRLGTQKGEFVVKRALAGALKH